jgi:hypothetical protein
VNPALLPVTVTVELPSAAFLFADIVSVEVPVAVTGFELNEDDVLDGSPEILSATELGPFTAVTVTVNGLLDPCLTSSVDTLVEIVKSADAVTVTLAVPFTPPLAAVYREGPAGG